MPPRAVAPALATALAAAALGACERAASPRPSASTRLVVEVRPDGPGGAVRRTVLTHVPAGVEAADFAPAPARTACTEIYGGPETAHVTGVLGGERIEADFRRTNGCEISRWDALAPVLGEAAGP